MVKGAIQDSGSPGVAAARELREESGLMLASPLMPIGVKVIGADPAPWRFFAVCLRLCRTGERIRPRTTLAMPSACSGVRWTSPRIGTGAQSSTRLSHSSPLGWSSTTGPLRVAARRSMRDRRADRDAPPAGGA
ncbi:NUDIX domain-containing protein [Caulobacter radicis]|uniref:NUDIX domain-containing protein n=1 Tax=Caulobacter radicis TaxID=2172650 RepID=UPI003CC59F02